MQNLAKNTETVGDGASTSRNTQIQNENLSDVAIEVSNAEADAEKLLLFTTKTCPKCRMAKMFLDQAGIAYETLLAEENTEAANAYGIKEAPTLVVVSGGSAKIISNPSNIKAFCDKFVRA